MISLLVYHSQLGQSDEMWVVLQEVRGKVELYSRQFEREELAMEDVSASINQTHVMCVCLSV